MTNKLGNLLCGLTMVVSMLGMGSQPVFAAEHVTEVVVYKNGKPSKGHKVSMEFTGGLMSGGMTGNFYTNSDGVASVTHASDGKVKVFVDGNHSSHGTTGKAPGRINVYLN